MLQQNKIIDNTSIKYYAFEIYISVENGHDETGDGSFSNPFKTITAGQAKLRKIRQNTPPQALKRAIIYLRQGIYYLNDLKKGKKVTSKNLFLRRPWGGLSLFDVKKILKHRLLKDVKKNEKLKINDFKK